MERYRPKSEAVPRYRPARAKFYPGHPKIGGRTAGTPNKPKPPMSAAAHRKKLNELVYEAMEASGYNTKGRNGAAGYLKRLADKEPRTFASLIAKTIPTQVVGVNDGPIPVLTIPQDRLTGLSEFEIILLEKLFGRIDGTLKEPISAKDDPKMIDVTPSWADE